jgi:hypothetical protein
MTVEYREHGTFAVSKREIGGKTHRGGMTYGDCQVSNGILGGPIVIMSRWSCTDQNMCSNEKAENRE